MEAVAEGENLPAELRERLEAALVEAGQRIGVNIGKGSGNARVVIALENGSVRWVEPTLIRVPASRLEEIRADG